MADEANQLRVQATFDDDAARLRLTGELDIHGAASVTDALQELADRHVKAVVVDVDGLTFLDSTGLRALLVGRDRVLESGASFNLEGVGGVVERVLDMTGLHDLLTDQAAG